MELLTRWSIGASPVILRPGSISRTPAASGELAKVWVNAIWFRSGDRRRRVVTFGSLWAIAPVGADGQVPLEAFVEHYDPRHHDRGFDSAVAFDGQTLTRRIGRRAVSPRRARTLASRLMSLHEAMSSASGDVPQVPDGWSGWYRLAAKG